MFSPRALKWKQESSLKEKKLGLLPARPLGGRAAPGPAAPARRAPRGRERAGAPGPRKVPRGRQRHEPGLPAARRPGPRAPQRRPGPRGGGRRRGAAGRGALPVRARARPHPRARGPRGGGAERAGRRRPSCPSPAVSRPPTAPTPDTAARRARTWAAGPGRAHAAPRGPHQPPGASAAAPFGLPPPGTHLLKLPERPPRPAGPPEPSGAAEGRGGASGPGWRDEHPAGRDVGQQRPHPRRTCRVTDGARGPTRPPGRAPRGVRRPLRAAGCTPTAPPALGGGVSQSRDLRTLLMSAARPFLTPETPGPSP
ncbi:uncharacterized protein [Manis javanica]|uniref:uncharacterized protein n=1 Tax=Manis javanica TaxID=9974 RepID=UPI003C6D2749